MASRTDCAAVLAARSAAFFQKSMFSILKSPFGMVGQGGRVDVVEVVLV
jgi:hypothetical protein